MSKWKEPKPEPTELEKAQIEIEVLRERLRVQEKWGKEVLDRLQQYRQEYGIPDGVDVWDFIDLCIGAADNEGQAYIP
jgi:hypothetical protein